MAFVVVVEDQKSVGPTEGTRTPVVYDLPVWADDFEPFPSDPIVGRGWKIGARAVSKEIGKSESYFKKMRALYPKFSVHSVDNQGTNWIAPQIVVEARTRFHAQKVLNLILACSVILEGNVSSYRDDLIALPHRRSRLEDLTEHDLRFTCNNTVYLTNVIPAAFFAARASRKKSLVYATFKLMTSFKLASAPRILFDPFYRTKNFSVEKDAQAHVTMASAITLAYSAIEELQLEPRSFGGRAVKSTKGVWDPQALHDLERRLKRSRINLAETMCWNVRGSATRIHRHARFPEGGKQSWSKGMVRDRSTAVCDALLGASWLRSKCTTHRYREETASITMFDVNNVQSLARRLLLEEVRLWRYWDNMND